ncbi:MAG: hypothetical protein GF401_04255 [Chitinivibrionales bacterium]|nr:hypothetical protein [Chitinivibrionales bacterium]
MIIVNPECDFIVRNIKAVKALIESYSLVEKRVHGWLIAQLKRKIEQRIDELPAPQNNWRVDEGDEEITLTKIECYSDNHEYGVYYGIENILLENLAAEFPEDGAWIYLCYNRPAPAPYGMANAIRGWEQRLIDLTNNNRKVLANNYRVQPDDTYLVTRYLHGILDAETIAENPEETINNTVATMIDFVRDTFQILVQIP